MSISMKAVAILIQSDQSNVDWNSAIKFIQFRYNEAEAQTQRREDKEDSQHELIK